ncbi:MAG: tetratricopeptide repeat protein [Chitinophagales bacterium]
MRAAISKYLLLSAGMLFLHLALLAQQINIPFTSVPYKRDIREGNKLFQIDSFSNAADAEAQYKKALDKENNAPVATFNLGDAIYQQGRYDTAAKWFELSAKTNPDSLVRAKAYHNLGNSYAKAKTPNWEEAAKAYKEALKLNPKDADTRYNLAYANEMLRQKNQGGGGGQNNQKNKQQQKQDDKQQQSKNDKNQQQKQNDEKQKQQNAGQQPKLNKNDAEQILQAIANEEQKTNQKMQQKQMKVAPIKIEKDW